MPSRVVLVLAIFLSFRAVAACQAHDDFSRRDEGPANSPSSIANTAQLLGLSKEIADVQGMSPSIARDAAREIKALWLRQRIYERILSASLEVDATTASIDNEIARATEVRGFLADKRDRSVTRANLLSALLGGGLGATSAGLQFSSKQVSAAAATGIAGGAISAGLAIYGIHAQRGATRTLDAESNMLAEFFDRPMLPASHYSSLIWEFLSQVAPTDPEHLTRRERLLHTWLELNRLDSLTSPTGKLKIDHVTSRTDQHLSQSVDDLDDRMAMLQDVRAKLSFLKRDLAALLASLPALSSDPDGSGSGPSAANQ